RRRKRLIVGDVAYARGLLAPDERQPERVEEPVELQPAQPDREIEPRQQQEGDQQERSPDEVRDRGKNLLHPNSPRSPHRLRISLPLPAVPPTSNTQVSVVGMSRLLPFRAVSGNLKHAGQ